MRKIKLSGGTREEIVAPTSTTRHHISRANSFDDSSGNFMAAFLSGVAAAGICAYAWGLLAVHKDWHIVYFAGGTALLVGLVVRVCGRGTQSVYGMTAATLTMLACVAGNVITMAMLQGQERQVDWVVVLKNLRMQPVLEWWRPRLQPAHVAFYIASLLIAHRLGYKRLA